MTLRIAALLAWVLAIPGLVLAQSPATHTPARQAPSAAAQRPGAVAPAATPQPAGAMLVDVNSADEKTLDALPGVGPARAKAIIANRPYTEKQQILSKKAVPSNVFTGIEDRIALANVNKTSAADLAKILPNVGPVRAQQIVDKRPYASLQDVVTKGALTQGVFDGLKGLITVGP